MNKIFNSFDKYNKGTHLYINIRNIEKLIHEDENDGDMNHVFSLLNTFVYSISDFITTKYKDTVIFEKLTGGRIHLIIKDTDNFTKIFFSLCEYSLKLSKAIVSFNQYRSISNVKLQFGADSGSFVDFNFKDGDYEEYTSIGACANYACKLQCKADDFELLISEDTLNKIEADKKALFNEVDNARQQSLNLNRQYKKAFSLNLLKACALKSFFVADFSSFIDKARDYSNNHPLKEMDSISARKLDFENWRLNKNAKFDAAVVFADIRGFTKKFDPENLNIELSKLTERILTEMYGGCTTMSGIHVQFQGDREFAFFSLDNCSDAVIFALKLSEKIQKEDGLSIGIGICGGPVYATKVGKESSFSNVKKQPVLIGKTVNVANKYEDDEASENEVVISSNIFNSLNDSLKRLFVFRKSYYVTSKTYKNFYNLQNELIQENNHLKSYYKPWCED